LIENFDKEGGLFTVYCSIKKKVKIKKKCIGSENVFTSARIALKTFTSTDQNPNWANQTLHHNHLSKEGLIT